MLRGADQPADTGEWLAFAGLADEERPSATSSHLSDGALCVDPTSAESQSTDRRSDAPAGCGQGKGEPPV
jgi:hypothetical protein